MARKLKRDSNCTGVVIDHITPHFDSKQLSIHYQQRDEDDETIGGGDIDGITLDELNLSEDSSILNDVTEEMLITFVSSFSDGLPVSMAAPPEE